jgi:hypothetical protein
MEHGPVDVLVVALGAPAFDGSILGELERLTSQGTIRVLDAMIMFKTDDGTVQHLDIEDIPAEEKAKLGFIETGTRGLFDSADAEMLEEGMVPGSGIVALAVEHVWAVGLVNAIYNQGAQVAIQYRVPAEAVDAAFATGANAEG